ncbi:MAG: hypothetical protein ACYDCJ_12390 [Gammaproteobacteria bacterium]
MSDAAIAAAYAEMEKAREAVADANAALTAADIAARSARTKYIAAYDAYYAAIEASDAEKRTP